MKKIFFIDGGAGRIIAAIPALLKYDKLNPNSDWSVLIASWDFLYWGIPELQDRTYNLDNKGLFDNIVKSADKIVTPEPYRVPAYFRQEISLSEAFDFEINDTTDHSDLPLPTLIFNHKEQLISKHTILELKGVQKKQKTIVFQPFGRGSKVENGAIFDEESRSISATDYLSLAKRLSQRYNLIFFGEPDFQLSDDIYSAKYTCDLRQWGSLIAEADYFVGCDSVGQHMAAAVGTPATVIFGSTFPINTSYPTLFQIIENKSHKKYSPIRISGLDTVLANRINESSMLFSKQELDDIFDAIVSDIDKKVK